MIPQTIHQIYGTFEDNIPIESIPIFHSQSTKTRQYCIDNNIDYKFWNGTDCRKLLDKYPQFKRLYEDFSQLIMRADFMRYLILYDEGGIYVDCDIAPISDISSLFNYDEFFVCWNNDTKRLPYNAVLGSCAKSKLYDDILNHMEESYYEKSSMDIYNSWKGRLVFQTTGHYMLKRVIKKHKSIDILDILKVNNKYGEVIEGSNAMFEDYNASIWYSK